MHTVIYVDVLLAVNLLLTYVLLLLTCLFMKIYVKTSYLFVGACVGAVFSLTVLLPDIGIILSFLLKAIMCLTIVAVTFRWRTLRQFVRCTLLFLFVNATVAGMILFLQNWRQNSILLYRNANVYFNINLPYLLVLTAACYCFLRLIIFLLHKSEHEQSYIVQIYFDGKYAECRAIVDTGNSLTDPVSGHFVSIVSLSVIAALLPNSVCSFLQGDFVLPKEDDYKWSKKLSLMNVSFAKGSSVLPAVRADRLVISDGKKKMILNNCTLAVTTNAFEQNDFKMLLHPCLMQDYNSQREESTDAVENV